MKFLFISALLAYQFLFACERSYASPQQDKNNLIVFGIRLGLPTSQLPSCGNNAEITEPCFATKGSDTLEPDYNVVEFAPSYTPLIATSALRLFIYRGNIIDGVAFDTGGIETQSNVEESLIKKYGPPTEKKRITLENKFGAEFDEIKDTWDLSDIHVFFEGVSEGDTDKGNVRILDNYGQKSLEAAIKALNKQYGGPAL